MSKTEESIKALESSIKRKQDDSALCSSAINVYKKRLTNVPSTELDSFVNAVYANAYLGTSETDKAKNAVIVENFMSKYNGNAVDEIINAAQEKAGIDWDILNDQASLSSLQSEAKSTSTKQDKQANTMPEEEPYVEQKGHVYPVKLVSHWTYKMKQYNKQMDDFLKDLDELSVDVDITWLCQKIEAFCRKINNALAWLRYEIVKALSAMYKQGNKFSELIDPIININPVNLPKVISWALKVVKFFLGPYQTVLQFIIDFMTYTPPLVKETSSLVGKVASVPGKLINSVNIVAESKDGEKKQIAEVYKEYMQIKFEPITLGDIIGGSSEQPKQEVSKGKQKQKELANKQVSAAQAKITQAWTELKDYMTRTLKGAKDIGIAYPVKINKTTSSNNDLYSYSDAAVARYGASSSNGIMTNVMLMKDIKGDKWVTTHDCCNVSFNSVLHKVYLLYSSKTVLNQMAEGSDLYNNVMAYYKQTYNAKSSLRTIKNTLPFIDYLKRWGTFCPEIPKYLDKIGVAVKDSIESEERKAELDKPSVYD